MSNIEERIEQNANIMLWCIEVAGPEDVHAAPNHKAAVEQATIWNQALYKSADENLDQILCFSFAAPWPHDDKSHAEDLLKWSEKIASPETK